MLARGVREAASRASAPVAAASAASSDAAALERLRYTAMDIGRIGKLASEGK